MKLLILVIKAGGAKKNRDFINSLQNWQYLYENDVIGLQESESGGSRMSIPQLQIYGDVIIGSFCDRHEFIDEKDITFITKQELNKLYEKAN